MIQDALCERRRVDPGCVAELVFHALDSERPHFLHDGIAVAYCLKAYTVFQSRRALAIAAQYDLPFAFYRLFLDADYYAYSCAVFPEQSVSLEVAQRWKFDLLAR